MLTFFALLVDETMSELGEISPSASELALAHDEDRRRRLARSSLAAASLAITEHLLRTTMRQFTEPREKDVYKWQTCLDYLSAHAA
jgi:hypothetical protein